METFQFPKDYLRYYKPCCFYADGKTAMKLFEVGKFCKHKTRNQVNRNTYIEIRNAYI